MKLKRETLINFKGMRAFTFEPNGNNVTVFGDNAKGKTSLYDGFLWVTSDKDSNGRKDFELKTLDETGKAIPMIDHAVEIVIEEAGKDITLRKTLSENWVKTRGSATQEFKGHTTAYEIDGVPRQKREFDSFISSLCNESLLRMLTDPDYFPGKLAWAERRKILMDICGDITDTEVIESDSKLAALPSFLQGRTIEDHRKVLAAKKTAVNNEIKAIPVRVDEATRALPVEGECSAEDVKAAIEEGRARIQDAETALLQLEQGGTATQKQLRLQQIETEIIAEQNKALTAHNTIIRDKQRLLNESVDRKESLGRKVTSDQANIKLYGVDIALYNKQLEEKRAAWMLEDSKELENFKADDVCPACGQSLPEDQIQAAKDAIIAAYNLDKSNRLEQIETEGKAINARLANAEKQKTILEKSVEVATTEIDVLAKKITTMEAEVNGINEKPIEESPVAKSLLDEKGRVLIDIKSLEESSEPERIRLTEQRDQLRQDVAEFEQAAARQLARADGLKRIQELKNQEKTLATEYEQLERQTYLTEEFIRVKVNLLEARINSRFRLARFKLFDVQVNGALNECCETTYNGVPYNSGLNNGARINVGLDIIRTLSEHYGFSAPIFIDNAESVTSIIETESQQIRLVVSEKDKELRVEAG